MSYFFKLKNIVSELNYILERKHKKNLVFIVLIIIISSSLELLGVSAILPLMQSIAQPQELMQIGVVKSLCEALEINEQSQLIVCMGLGIMVIYILKNVFLIYAAYQRCKFGTTVNRDLCIKMLQSYLSRPYEYYLDVNSAQIIRGCGGDVSGVYTILLNLIMLGTEGLTAIMIAIYMFQTDPVIAIVAVFLMLILLIGMTVGYKPIFKNIGKRKISTSTQKSKVMYQTLSGIKEVYVTQRKEHFLNNYKKLCDEEMLLMRKRDTLAQTPNRIAEGICVSGIIGVVCLRIGGSPESAMSFVPKLAVFAMAAFQIFPSVGKITSIINDIVFFMPALDNVHAVMHDAELYNKMDEEYVQSCDKDEKEDIIFRDQLVVNNITWKYKGQKEPVLRGASITIKKGESIGLIGPSGSGKTTISDVILGLLKPQEGHVYMDGRDVYTMPKKWSQIIGYVPQNVFLIDDTVRNNILFGLPNDGNDEKIWNALEQAQLKSFVESLPNGLETIVGERGVKFSGGQRQRIAIARALYNRPQILVLDEATAALDNETEEAVMQAVEALQGQITLIIVAHRLTTIRKCSAVFEIKDGVATVRDKKEFI